MSWWRVPAVSPRPRFHASLLRVMAHSGHTGGVGLTARSEDTLVKNSPSKRSQSYEPCTGCSASFALSHVRWSGWFECLTNRRHARAVVGMPESDANAAATRPLIVLDPVTERMRALHVRKHMPRTTGTARQRHDVVEGRHRRGSLASRSTGSPQRPQIHPSRSNTNRLLMFSCGTPKRRARARWLTSRGIPVAAAQGPANRKRHSIAASPNLFLHHGFQQSRLARMLTT